GLLAPLAFLMSLIIFYEVSHLEVFAPKKPKQAYEREELKNNWMAFGHLILAIICRSVLMICLRVFFPLYMIAHLGQSKSAAAVALTVFGLSGIIGNILGGTLADRYGYRIVIKVTYFLMIPLVLAFPFLNNLILVYLDLILMGFMLYASYSPIVVMGQKYLPKNIGFSAGITLGLSISIGGLFSPILGLIADHYGLTMVFYTFGVLGILGFIFTLFLVPITKK
ncbi:MAG: MFS transporter, partial [Desulfovibrionaceae bacterium]|nr:MFS transporter [Desulfovibrionaceae bacterium]